MRARRLRVPTARGDQAGWLCIVILLAIRTVLGFYRISLPGLQNDETLFVNAATLRVPGEFITHQIHGIPLMVFPYIGALKSWIYAPIFSLFGNSALTIRLPAELIASAGLLLLYPAIRDLVSRPVALAAVAALCFDNSLFWLTRDDVGPNAIELLMKCAVIFCAARLASDRRARWVLLLLLMLALGVFNKLNFIWVVNATAACSVIVAVINRQTLRREPTSLIIWFGGLALIYGCFAAYYFGDNVGLVGEPAAHGSVLAHTWPQYLSGIKLVLSGVWFYGYALAPIEPRMIIVYAVVVAFLAGAIASVLPGTTRSTPIALLALTTLLMSAQTLATYQATAGWHYVSVYPYVTVVAIYGAWSVLRRLLRHPRQIGVGLATLTAALLAYDGVLMNKYFGQIEREPSFSAWSPAIYRLNHYVQRTPGTIFVADWGILNPLFALDPSHRYRDYEFALISSAPANLRGLAAGVAATPGPKLFITHANAKLIFPTVNANLDTSEAGHMRLIRRILGQDGKPVYLVYAYRAQGV